MVQLSLSLSHSLSLYLSLIHFIEAGVVGLQKAVASLLLCVMQSTVEGRRDKMRVKERRERDR